jgi:hypothetical protein
VYECKTASIAREILSKQEIIKKAMIQKGTDDIHLRTIVVHLCNLRYFY